MNESTLDRRPLSESDPDIFALVREETARQEYGLEMIPSENFVSEAVLEANGSVLTNKYAEGLPGRRYYGGCEVVDKVEDIARERVLSLFGAEFTNVQPHSGAAANQAVFEALIEPGDGAIAGGFATVMAQSEGRMVVGDRRIQRRGDDGVGALFVYQHQVVRHPETHIIEGDRPAP